LTIPVSGNIDSEMVRAEWGLAYPLTSAAVAAAAGLGPPYSADSLRGRSSVSLRISLGGTTRTRVGGQFSTSFRAQRTLTSVITGFTPASYQWSISATWAGLGPATGPTSTVGLIYDVETSDPDSDQGTIFLTVYDTNGVPHSTSVGFAL
jgi:hypothetical protein